MAAEVTFPRVLNASPTSRMYVSQKYESLDYDVLDSEVYIENEEERGKSYMMGIIILRVVIFATVGVLVATVGTITELGCNYTSMMRYALLYETTNTNLFANFPKVIYAWTLSMITPGMIASVLVTYGEPMAAGGGPHFALSFLNGVNLSNLMAYKVVIIKIVGVILTVMSGLPSGKEGPMVFMGCVIGSITPFMSFLKYRPFSYFQQDPERLTLGTAGTAAGFTAAFGTPIAGIMIAFEENLSLWSGELTFLIFIAAFTSGFVLKFLSGIILEECVECFASDENIFLQSMHKADKSYLMTEMPLYILFGVIGGVLGAVWNMLQDEVAFLRRRYLNTPAKRLIDATLALIINGVIQAFLVRILADYCIEETRSKTLKESSYNPSVIKLRCTKNNEYSAAGLFMFQNIGGIFRNLFTENEGHIGLVPLALFGLYLYFGTGLLTGCQLCTGIFMPHIVIGNIWGRMIAEILNICYPETVPWARPNKFALLCGAAQLCGTLRTSFTICVMMLESCNNVTLGIPIFIVVFTARFVGNCFNLPLMIRQSSFLGIPLLDREPPPLLTHIKILDIISASPKPVVTLPLIPTYRMIGEALSNNTHNGFPIVSRGPNSSNGVNSYGVLKGFILRSRIKILLKYRQIFNNRFVSSRKKTMLLHEEFSKELVNEAITWTKEEDNHEIDLSPFMDPTPHFVHLNCSLSHAYRTFASLGLRHLVVVNDRYEVVGMITRKDLSVFRFIRHRLFTDIVKLPLRDQ